MHSRVWDSWAANCFEKPCLRLVKLIEKWSFRFRKLEIKEFKRLNLNTEYYLKAQSKHFECKMQDRSRTLESKITSVEHVSQMMRTFKLNLVIFKPCNMQRKEKQSTIFSKFSPYSSRWFNYSYGSCWPLARAWNLNMRQTPYCKESTNISSRLL